METYEISTENILFLIWKFVIFDSKEFFPFSRSLFSVSVFFCMFTYSQQCHLTKKHLQLRPWSDWLLVFWLEEDFDPTLEHKNRTSKAAFINKGQWSRQGCNSKDFTQIWQKGSLILNKNGPSSKSGHSQTAQEILKRIAHTVDNFQDFHFKSDIKSIFDRNFLKVLQKFD